MRTLYAANLAPLAVGDRVLTFRGEPARLVGTSEPAHAGSTGRVHLQFFDEAGRPSYTGSYYPGVINAHWGDEVTGGAR